MESGLLKSASELQFRLSVSGSGVKGGAGYRYGGRLESWWANHPAFPVQTQVLITIDKGDLTGTFSEMRVTAPFISYENLSFSGSEVLVAFLDFKLYWNEFGGYTVKYSGVEIRVDGSVVSSYAGRTLSSINSPPVFIPLIGVPPLLSCHAGPTTLPALAVGGGLEGIVGTSADSYEDSASCSAVGGWRFKVGTDYEEYPVKFDFLNAPNGSGCNGDMPALTPVTDCTTWTGSVVGFGTSSFDCGLQEVINCSGTDYKVWKSTTEYESNGSSMYLWPCLDRLVTKLSTGKGDDYEAMIVRGGFPTLTAKSGASGRDIEVGACTDYPEFDEDCADIITKIQNPPHTTLLSVVGDESHVIEDPLDTPIYSFYSCNHFKGSTEQYGYTTMDGTPTDLPEGCCPEGTKRRVWGETYSNLLEVTPNYYIYTYLIHPSPNAIAINTWYNPHFSYAYYFPTDSDGTHWQVNDAKVSSDGYWSRIRQQYLTHSALPSSEKLEKRNFLISAGTSDDAIGFNVATYMTGAQSSYWGTTRNSIEEYQFPTSKTLTSDSYDSFTVVDCHKTSVTGGIELNATDHHTVFELHFDLCQFDRVPFYQLVFAREIENDWVDTNVDSIECYLESTTGERVLITDTKIKTKLPKGNDIKYAGSWKNQFGDLIEVDDEGYDQMETGETGMYSDIIYGSERGVLQAPLLPNKTGTKIVWVVTPTDYHDPVTIKYPKFYFPTTQPKIIYETAQTTWIGFEDGPAIRVGQWGTWNYTLDELIYPPAPQNPNGNFSMLDYCIWKRLVLEGVHGLNGHWNGLTLHEELEILMDEVECPPRSTNALRRNAAYWTRVFPVRGTNTKLRFNICRTYRTGVPPLAVVPNKRVVNYTETGDFVLQSVSVAQTPRYLISPVGQECHIYYNDVKLSNVVPIGERIEGFTISKYDPVVDNTELLGAYIKQGSKKRAVCSPWHGYTYTLSNDGGGKGVHLTTMRETGLVVATIVTNTGIEIKIFDAGSFTKSNTIEETGVEVAQCAVHPQGYLVLAYDKDNSTIIKNSYDLGETWV